MPYFARFAPMQARSMRKKILVSAWLLLIVYLLPARAQDAGFVPGKTDLSMVTKLSQACEQRYSEETRAISGKNKKDYLDVYKTRWTHLKECFDQHEVFTDGAAQAYLDRMAADIVKANPVLQGRSFYCYFSREYIPNAAYMGEGVIFFNMGLFSRLHDESEVAFVLCHEISHFLLRHAENGIAKYVEMINSDEVQKDLRKINRSEYGKREQLDKMVKGLTFDSRRHSRDHESQADSMAVELMRHTRFAMAGALSALGVLDVIDKDSLATTECLQRVFNAPEYPWQKKWLAKNTGLLGGHAVLKEEEMADSLKTHPDCRKRIELLKPLVERGGQTGGSAFADDSSQFMVLQDRFRYETIEYAFESKRYTRCLFLSLQLLERKPADTYLVASVGRVLNGIYEHQKAHTLGTVVSLPSPDFPPNYNMLLQFVQNLYLENIAGINYYYLKPYRPRMESYGIFRDVYAQCEKNFQLQ